MHNVLLPRGEVQIVIMHTVLHSSVVRSVDGYALFKCLQGSVVPQGAMRYYADIYAVHTQCTAHYLNEPYDELNDL